MISIFEKGVPTDTIQESYKPPESDILNVQPMKGQLISTNQLNKMKCKFNLKVRLDKKAVCPLFGAKQYKDSIFIY
jgi:hypothetical protein